MLSQNFSRVLTRSICRNDCKLGTVRQLLCMVAPQYTQYMELSALQPRAAKTERLRNACTIRYPSEPHESALDFAVWASKIGMCGKEGWQREAAGPYES